MPGEATTISEVTRNSTLILPFPHKAYQNSQLSTGRVEGGVTDASKLLAAAPHTANQEMTRYYAGGTPVSSISNLASAEAPEDPGTKF